MASQVPEAHELESLKTAGNCPKGGQHTLGAARMDDKNMVAYPVLTRFCGKCEVKLWLLEDIDGGPGVLGSNECPKGGQHEEQPEGEVEVLPIDGGEVHCRKCGQWMRHIHVSKGWL